VKRDVAAAKNGMGGEEKYDEEAASKNATGNLEYLTQSKR